MQISLTKEDVLRLSKQYQYDSDDKLTKRLRKAVRRGCMTRVDLVEVAKWKWRGGRTRRLAAENAEKDVREISRASFSAVSDRLRIGALLALRGVSWPMASVILHFAFPQKYPILDVRAMRTVDGSTNYTFEAWIEYTRLCRKTAESMGVTMRVLDRALWAFDKKSSRRKGTRT